MIYHEFEKNDWRQIDRSAHDLLILFETFLLLIFINIPSHHISYVEDVMFLKVQFRDHLSI